MVITTVVKELVTLCIALINMSCCHMQWQAPREVPRQNSLAQQTYATMVAMLAGADDQPCYCR